MNWINVKESLPDHQQIVLAFSMTKSGKLGYGVATFVDSVKMNQELKKAGYENECVDVDKNPYYFCSQEVKSRSFNDISYWMELPKNPE